MKRGKGKGKEDNTTHKQSTSLLVSPLSSPSSHVTGWVEGSDVTLGVGYPIVYTCMHANPILIYSAHVALNGSGRGNTGVPRPGLG